MKIFVMAFLGALVGSHLGLNSVAEQRDNAPDFYVGAQAVETPPIQLTPEQVAEAKRLANGFRGVGPDGIDVYVDPTGQSRDPNAVPWDITGPIWDWKPSPIVATTQSYNSSTGEWFDVEDEE